MSKLRFDVSGELVKELFSLPLTTIWTEVDYDTQNDVFSFLVSDSAVDTGTDEPTFTIPIVSRTPIVWRIDWDWNLKNK